MCKNLKLLTVVALLLTVYVRAMAESDSLAVFKRWQAGKRVTLAMVESYGIDRCFAIDTISNEIFSRLWKKSYKENCTIPRSDLRYLKVLHYTRDGSIRLGELVCNKDIATDLIEIFGELFKAKYPIEQMVLIDNYDADDNLSMADNNTTCFNFRTVSGTNKLSNHSQGRAIDINPLYNPYVKTLSNGRQRVSPLAGKAYTDRKKTFPYKITRGDLCYRLFLQHGFQWGGNWKSLKDYQHFEKSSR